MTPRPATVRRLADVRQQIRDGDLLLWRRRRSLKRACIFAGLCLSIALLPLLCGLLTPAAAAAWGAFVCTLAGLVAAGSLIAVAGRGEHTHAAIAAWWGDELLVLEVRELAGGRAVTLASQVARYPGLIEVYETNAGNLWPAYDRAATVAFMRRLTGCGYGWRNLARAALSHLPIVRIFAQVDIDDDTLSSNPPFCSQAVAMAVRLGGGLDAVTNLADHVTEPSDLARSPFFGGAAKFALLP